MKVNNNSAIGQSNQGAGIKKNLNIEDFLQIMAAEIKNQNPMSSDGGGSKTDYISQLAQFTTLDQLTSITDSLSYLNIMSQQQYAFTLIGKEVKINTGEVGEDGKAITIDGTVDKVKFNNGIITIEVNGENYYLGSIIEVGNQGEGKSEEAPEEDSKEDPKV